MVRVIQITDTHVVVPPDKVSGRIDSARMLETAVARILSDLPRIGPVDAVLVTGDVSDDGTADSYGLFRTLLAPLDLPMFVIPGNHDKRDPMRAAFADHGYFPAAGRLNWVARIGPMHLIGLDTLVEGQGGGSLDDDTLDFLTEALAAMGRDPVLLAMHHPPFASGIRFMDAIGLGRLDRLAGVLDGCKAEVRIVCGHIHSVMAGSVGPVTALSGPATCSTFAADFRHDAPTGFFTAPGGYMIHDWDAGFRSVHVGAVDGEGPFPF